jgi:hypothetical protein
LILHDDLAGLEFFKMVQNRTGFVRLAFGENILSLIALSCRRLAFSVSPISFRLTIRVIYAMLTQRETFCLQLNS